MLGIILNKTFACHRNTFILLLLCEKGIRILYMMDNGTRDAVCYEEGGNRDRGVRSWLKWNKRPTATVYRPLFFPHRLDEETERAKAGNPLEPEVTHRWRRFYASVVEIVPSWWFWIKLGLYCVLLGFSFCVRVCREVKCYYFVTRSSECVCENTVYALCVCVCVFRYFMCVCVMCYGRINLLYRVFQEIISN